MGIVDLLEMVEIDEQERTVMTVAARFGKLAFETVEQQTTVGQMSERIVERKPFDLVLRGMPFGDVQMRAGDAQRPPFGISRRYPAAG